jgi:hypothetical protein
VDYIALPAMVSAADVAATGITLQLIVQAQAERAGEPVFLGLIPNRVPRNGSIERAFLDVVLKGGKILPFIPASETLRANLSRRAANGGEAAVQYAPRSAVAARLKALWEGLKISRGASLSLWLRYFGQLRVCSEDCRTASSRSGCSAASMITQMAAWKACPHCGQVRSPVWA